LAHAGRAAAQVNRRTACSVCATPYAFLDSVETRAFRPRLRAAARKDACWLAASTLTALAVSALCFFAFAAFETGWLPLPSFPVRNVEGAQYTTCMLGVAAAALGAGAWRAALAAQPQAIRTRELLSAPDAAGRRTPLFALALPRPPTAREAAAAARARQREQRLRAVAARARMDAAV
jgi:hypothetical protein